MKYVTRHFSITLKVVSIVCFCLIFVRCDGGIYGDNSNQKKISRSLLNKITSPSKNITMLPSYNSACEKSQPKVAHSHCINIAIEGLNINDANSKAIDLSKEIEALKSKGDLPLEIRGSLAVITPIYRLDIFSGDPTPSSLAEHFASGTVLSIAL